MNKTMTLVAYDKDSFVAQVDFQGQMWFTNIDPAITDPLQAILAIQQGTLASYQDFLNKKAEQATRPDLTVYYGDDISSGVPVPPK